MDAPLLRLAKVRREFPAGEETITVLRDVDLEIRAGEFIAGIGLGQEGIHAGAATGLAVDIVAGGRERDHRQAGQP